MSMTDCQEIRSRFKKAIDAKAAFDAAFRRLPSVGQPPVLAIHELPVREAKERRTELQSSLTDLREFLHPFSEFEAFLGKENVHGMDDVEKTLGFRPLPSQIKPFHYTRADLQRSKELKAAGIKEMLILAPVEGSLSGKRMNEMISKTYERMGLGKFLNNPTGWYKIEPFFTEGSASRNSDIQFEWKLVTKECIPGSKGKHHHWEEGDSWKHEETQQYLIEQLAIRHGLKPEQFRRPEPFEMLYAIALHLIATTKDGDPKSGERLLKGEYHWSDRRDSDGDLVRVGYADADGARVFALSRDGARGWHGVCLSR